MIPAAMPICACVGSTPTSTVASPITVIVTRNVYLRPMMSPSAPKNTAPNGRTRNPAAYAANAASAEAVGLSLGKKIGARNGVSVGEGGGVSERLAAGDVPQQPSHDLSRAGLRQLRSEHHRLRAGDGADRLHDVLAELLRQLLAALVPAAERYEREDRLAGDRVLASDDRRFGDLRM